MSHPYPLLVVLFFISLSDTREILPWENAALQNTFGATPPEFVWTGPFSMNVSYPDGEGDQVFLKLTSSLPGVEDPCLFSGSFVRETSASIVVSGCRNESLVEITIFSQNIPGRNVFIIRNGTVEEFDGAKNGNDGQYVEDGIYPDDEVDPRLTTTTTMLPNSGNQTVGKSGGEKDGKNVGDKAYLDNEAHQQFTTLPTTSENEDTTIRKPRPNHVNIVSKRRIPASTVEITLAPHDETTTEVEAETKQKTRRSKRSADVGPVDDFLIPPPDQSPLTSGGAGSDGVGGARRPPQEAWVNMKLGFEDSFLRKMGSQQRAREWINRVVTHGKSYFLDASLKTRIHIKFPENPQYYPGHDWQPDLDLSKARQYQQDASVPVTFFCHKENTYYDGFAYVGGACRTDGEHWGVSLQKWNSNSVYSAQTFAHETGHLFGMSHDFFKNNAGIYDNYPDRYDSNKRACKNTGLMSYGNPLRVTKWSTCSLEDFNEWYDKRGYSCLKAITNTCFEEGVNTQLREMLDGPTKVDSWGDCAKKCGLNSDCTYWTWAHAGAGDYAFNCALMSGFERKVDDVNTISGPKACQALDYPKYLRVSSKAGASIEQKGRMGKYVLQDGSKNNFPVWKKEGANQYLFVAGDDYWGIGSDLESNVVGIYLSKKDPTPMSPLIAAGWQYWDEEWHTDETIRVEVFTESQFPEYLQVGSSGGVSKEHGEILGKYRLSLNQHNKFPIWKQEDGGHYLFVTNNGYWGFGDDINSIIVKAYFHRNEPTPASPTDLSGWYYFDQEWKMDNTLAVSVNSGRFKGSVTIVERR